MRGKTRAAASFHRVGSLTAIRVESYAGHKADETPRRMLWEGEWIEVEEVLDRWHQVESQPEWPRADYFKVRGADQCEYLIKHDLESDEWYLGRRWGRQGAEWARREA